MLALGDLVRRRFIPTHVGNTAIFSFSVSRYPVHPHACGEHKSWVRSIDKTSGSSPRMWGTHFLTANGPNRHRFIPTHVGNTGMSSMMAEKTTVHPHACGEHFLPCQETFLNTGSSPRMWGTPFRFWSRDRHLRFIPTHVGNTRRSGKQGHDGSVHPHACGEHIKWHFSPPLKFGSSPRMWGTRIYKFSEALVNRFIPTHVGNTREQPAK